MHKYLNYLIPTLLKGMVYSDIDIMILGGEEDDQNVPDRPQDIKPRFHTAREATYSQEEEEDSEEDWYIWNRLLLSNMTHSIIQHAHK